MYVIADNLILLQNKIEIAEYFLWIFIVQLFINQLLAYKIHL